MKLFWREIRSSRKSTVIWTGSLSLLVFTFFLMYPSFVTDVAVSRGVLSNLPIALRSALDISLENFFTVFGFFAYLLTFVSLAGAVQAMNLGVGLLSKEETNKTIDFLLTKPISRPRVVTEKIAAGVCLLLFTNIVFSSVALVSAKMASSENFSNNTFLMLTAVLLFIQLVFFSFGILSSVLFGKIKSSISISLPAVFAFFVVGTVASIIDKDIARYVSPFKFFSPIYVIDNGSYELKFLIIEVALIAAAIVASYIIYIKKDIRAVS